MPDQRPLCRVCGVNLARKMYQKGRGHTGYYDRCTHCYEAPEARAARKKRYRKSPGYKAGKKRYQLGPGYKAGKKRYREERSAARKPLAPCVLCGFVPIDRCQIDRDHIDGNHANDDPANLQLICANCHRLKSKRHRDGWYAAR